MRPIDRLAIRHAKAVSLEELRAAGASPDALREQVRAHYIDLARYLADIGAHTDLSNIRASERREVERRHKVIAELRAGIPQTTSIPLAAARMRLLNRSTK